jgi:di/tricarboxylate transporter
MLRSQGLEPFGFFDYTPIGLVLLAVGVLFMLLAGRRLLPDYKPRSDVQRVETPAELLDIYRLPEDLFRLRVRRSSDLVGLTIDQARLRQDYSLTALKILRHPASLKRSATCTPSLRTLKPASTHTMSWWLKVNPTM